jgi:copper oxidase (laccase) domain-containing protein
MGFRRANLHGADAAASIQGLQQPRASTMEQFHGTTILSVRRNGAVVIGGDGQVSLGRR